MDTLEPGEEEGVIAEDTLPGVLEEGEDVRAEGGCTPGGSGVRREVQT